MICYKILNNEENYYFACVTYKNIILYVAIASYICITSDSWTWNWSTASYDFWSIWVHSTKRLYLDPTIILLLYQYNNYTW